MTDNKVEERLLRTVTESGPIWRAVLEGLAAKHGARYPDDLVTAMIKRGALVKYGDRRGTRSGRSGVERLMARPRTLDDRLLSLLALHPFPFTISEIVIALDTERHWLVHVLERLREQDKVIRLDPPASTDTRGGRPAMLWALPGALFAPAELIPLMKRLMPGTAAVTPSGREAIVRMLYHDGFARIEYTDGDRGDTTIHVKLLRAFQAGRARPEPVRVV